MIQKLLSWIYIYIYIHFVFVRYVLIVTYSSWTHINFIWSIYYSNTQTRYIIHTLCINCINTYIIIYFNILQNITHIMGMHTIYTLYFTIMCMSPYLSVSDLYAMKYICIITKNHLNLVIFTIRHQQKEKLEFHFIW